MIINTPMKLTYAGELWFASSKDVDAEAPGMQF